VTGGKVPPNVVQSFVAEFVKNFEATRAPVESLDDFRYIYLLAFFE